MRAWMMSLNFSQIGLLTKELAVLVRLKIDVSTSLDAIALILFQLACNIDMNIICHSDYLSFVKMGYFACLVSWDNML